MLTKTAYDFAAKTAQYRTFNAAQLAYSLTDAINAREAMRGWNPAAENWYADDVATIGQVQRTVRA